MDSDGTPVGDWCHLHAGHHREQLHLRLRAGSRWRWATTSGSTPTTAALSTRARSACRAWTVELYYDSDGSGDFTPGDDVHSSTNTDASGTTPSPAATPASRPRRPISRVITDTNFTPGRRAGELHQQHRSLHGQQRPQRPRSRRRQRHAGQRRLVASDARLADGGRRTRRLPDPDGNTNLTLDFGFYQLSLGDQVWYDANNNGVIDGAKAAPLGRPSTFTTSPRTCCTPRPPTTAASTPSPGSTPAPATWWRSSRRRPTPAAPTSPHPTPAQQRQQRRQRRHLGRRQHPQPAHHPDGGLHRHVEQHVVDTLPPARPTTPPSTSAWCSTLSLGNYVWFDTNNDGVGDTTEVGVARTWRSSYTTDSDGSGDFTPGVDQLISTTTTDASGSHYTFTELLPSRTATETYVGGHHRHQLHDGRRAGGLPEQRRLRGRQQRPQQSRSRRRQRHAGQRRHRRQHTRLADRRRRTRRRRRSPTATPT